MCQAVSAFARQPTKENLVEQLKRISRIDPEGASNQRLWFYPWQIAICLTAKNIGRSWHEIISGVEAGDMGAEGDWTRWEARNKNRISLSQFRCGDDLRVSDEMQGLILRESGWSRDVGRKQGIQFAAALSDALAQWPEISQTQQELVDLCCFDLYDKLGLTCCESSAWQIYHDLFRAQSKRCLLFCARRGPSQFLHL